MASKFSLGGVCVAAALMFSASTVSAAPVIQYEIRDGATVIGTGSSATGFTLLAGSSANFNVSGSATSAPLLSVPDFSTNTFTISSAAAAARTLTILISTTGLTGYTGGTVANTFTLNSLLGGSFSSGTISTYFDNSNAAYGTGTLLATQTFSGLNSFSTMDFANASPSALFSETAIYTLNYDAGGTGTVSASAQLNNAVPEPATWGMMILGFGAVGFAMRRRREKVSVRFA